MATTRVYYNSACPVCKMGVENQQCTLNAEGVSDVEWLDVHQRPELAAELGIELEALRERLHVQSASGEMRVGSDAFASLFALSRHQRWLGRLISVPGVRWLTQGLYKLFARALYRWNRAKGHW
ncbi:MAG: DUF393 domain-containing protein [Burkholderiales bacterium]|nr:DUF393 domain-containing protein [Burkholderiales bacterium]